MHISFAIFSHFKIIWSNCIYFNFKTFQLKFQVLGRPDCHQSLAELGNKSKVQTVRICLYTTCLRNFPTRIWPLPFTLSETWYPPKFLLIKWPTFLSASVSMPCHQLLPPFQFFKRSFSFLFRICILRQCIKCAVCDPSYEWFSNWDKTSKSSIEEVKRSFTTILGIGKTFLILLGHVSKYSTDIFTQGLIWKIFLKKFQTFLYNFLGYKKMELYQSTNIIAKNNLFNQMYL